MLTLRGDGWSTWSEVCEIVDGHFKGDIEHVGEALSLLWKTLHQADNATEPSNIEASVRLFITEPKTHTDFLDSLHTSYAPQIGRLSIWQS